MRARCPDSLNLAFAKMPPYVYKEKGSAVSGVFVKILTDALNFWCPDQTNITFTEVTTGFVGLEEKILNDTADVIFPVPYALNKKFFIGRPFIPVVETPGIAFYTTVTPNAKNAIADAISNGWPALVIVIMSALIAGMIFWISDLVQQWWNPKKMQSREASFFEGPFRGFYWAMVSMTTVGYGDFYPRSSFGRVIATLWILMGIVITSMFTATVTTILLAAVLASDISLSGTSVGVLESSIEYNLAVKRNAFPIAHTSIDHLLSSATNSKHQAALLDSFIAGHFQEKFIKFRLVEIIEHVFSYGIVLSDKGLWLEPNIRSYMQNNKEKLFKIMSMTIRPLKPRDSGSDAEKKSNSLLSIHNKAVFATLVGTMSMILILSILGLLWEKTYLRRRCSEQKSEHKEIERQSISAPENSRNYFKDQFEVLGGIQREMDSFIDLLRVHVALSNQKNNCNVFEDDDLAISNIELVS
ncbi:uncharacterized protein LOC135686791 [Rhopilema esculentum]|uniref:uncharacterized protein LOC135686791 n=1 Tax=Rhopilema esculentum TaxID=499914 RepID=UPI0031DD3A83|eukprot:gene3095-1385_t